MKDTAAIEQEQRRRNEELASEMRAELTNHDAPVCPWCDRQGWDICQHADDARNCDLMRLMGIET